MTDIIKYGLLLILGGFALIILGTPHNTGFGGLIMIGPIPVTFGSSPEMNVIAMVMGLLLMLAYFIIGRRNA